MSLSHVYFTHDCRFHNCSTVDVPNAVCTLAVPLAIFDRDVRPPADLEHFAKGIKAITKDVCISEEGGAVPYDPRLDE